ncbi:MAG: SpoIIIAH-like family protein [Christensenellales bacterium]|jgi:hypothetical protein
MKKPVEIIRGKSRDQKAERTERPRIKLDKKRILTIGGCALLIAVAVWANMTLSTNVANRIKTADDTPNAFEGDLPQQSADVEGTVEAGAEDDYFAVFKANRDATREKELEYLSEMIADENTDSDTKTSAQEQKLALIDAMEKEMVIEGLLQAKGFKGVAVTVKKGSVNIVVDRESMSDTEIAQILDIAITETGEPAENIKVLKKLG